MFYLPIGRWLSNLDLSLIILQILAGFGVGSFGQLLVERYKWKVSNSKAHLISVYVKFKGASLELLTAFISLSPTGIWFSDFCHDAFLKWEKQLGLQVTRGGFPRANIWHKLQWQLAAGGGSLNLFLIDFIRYSGKLDCSLSAASRSLSILERFHGWYKRILIRRKKDHKSWFISQANTKKCNLYKQK